MIDIDRILTTLESVLGDYVKFKEFDLNFQSTEFPIASLKTSVNSLLLAVFSDQTKLLLLHQLLDDFFSTNKQVSIHNYYVHESDKLLSKFNLETEIRGNWQKALDSHEERDIENAYYHADHYLPIQFIKKSFLKEIENSKSKDQLREIFNKLLNQYREDIDMIAYHNFEIKKILPSTQEGDNNKDDFFELLEFTDLWQTGKITLSTWKAHHNNDFLGFLDDKGGEEIRKINNLQLELYNKALDYEITSLTRQFNELSTANKLPIAHLHKKLLTCFFDGTFSEIDLARLKNIIYFDRQEEVLIAYDNFNRFEFINFRELLPFDGPYGRKSPRFAAEILVKYHEFISNYLSNPKNESIHFNKKSEASIKATYQSFGFFNKNQSNVLEKVILELNSLFAFVDTSKTPVSSVVNILIAADYSTEESLIYSGCNTVEFCYTLKALSKYFSNLTGKSIENSQKFYTSNSRLLSQSNFHKSGNSFPKLKEDIDNIIQQLK
jgi:hypothetical protein